MSARTPVPAQRRGYHSSGLGTRKRIMKAAIRLFSEQGFDKTTVRDIAEECRITDAAIYYHFSSKRALLDALYEESGIMAALEAIEKPVVGDSLREQMVAAAKVTADLFIRNTDLLRITLVGVLMGDWGASALHEELRERWRRALENLLTGYAEQNRLNIHDVRRASETLVHVVMGAFLERVAKAPRGRSRRAAEKAFREHLASMAFDLAAIWERRDVGPFRVRPAELDAAGS